MLVCAARVLICAAVYALIRNAHAFIDSRADELILRIAVDNGRSKGFVLLCVRSRQTLKILNARLTYVWAA